MSEKYSEQVTIEVSAFHDGENFICEIRRTSDHTIDGEYVFNHTGCELL